MPTVGSPTWEIAAHLDEMTLPFEHGETQLVREALNRALAERFVALHPEWSKRPIREVREEAVRWVRAHLKDWPVRDKPAVDDWYLYSPPIDEELLESQRATVARLKNLDVGGL